MSEYVLSLIPEDPSYVPPAEAQSQALEAFHAFLTKKKPFQVKASARWDEPKVEIELDVSEDIQFVDQGENFESVSCPACDTEIDTKSWGEWMGKSSESNFVDRSVTMPCCGCETELNALRYDWPAGFARFVLRAVDPDIKDGMLPAEKLSALEEVLGCKLRQIWTHY
jgi:hypothetical protein